MLFDLRGRHRRRLVRVIYVGLALLMGSGLVLLGIGGGAGSGGILSSLTGAESSSKTSYAAEISKYRKLTKQQPSDEAAWEGLTKALLHEAGGETLSTSSGLTSKGKEIYSETAQAWASYLALNPKKPSAELAELMVRIFDEEGLNEPADVVAALQIVVAGRPESASLYAELAEYAYRAKNERVGDLASAKAVELAPAEDRARLKSELAAIKKNPTGTTTSSTTGTESSSVATSTNTTSTVTVPSTKTKTSTGTTTTKK